MVNLSTQRGIIFCVVIINGILRHTTRYLKTYGWNTSELDIICNILMGLFINIIQGIIYSWYTMIRMCNIYPKDTYYGHRHLLHILGETVLPFYWDIYFEVFFRTLFLFC